MNLPRLSLKVKLPLFFIAIALIPLIAITALWFSSFRSEFIEIAKREITETTKQVSAYTDNYFSTKILSLIIHSQTQAVITGDTEESRTELQNLLLQDEDIREVILLDTTGKEVIRLNREREFEANELKDRSNDPIYKLTTFVGGDKYVGPVIYEDSNTPTVVIAVPVVLPEFAQSLQEINTSSIGRLRTKGEILGILIVNVNLNNLLSYINNVKVGKDGYVYVVDNQGRLISHPDKSITTKKTDLSRIGPIENFVEDQTRPENSEREPSETLNEADEESLILARHLSSINWGIITVQPLSEINEQISITTTQAAMLIIGTFIIVALISIFVASQITLPIEKLKRISGYVAKGSLDYRVLIKTGDELESLAGSFNYMADKLKEDRKSLIAEKNTLSTVLGNIADGVIALDKNFKVLFFNNASHEITGINPEAVIGERIEKFLTFKEKNKAINIENICVMSNDKISTHIITFQKNKEEQKSIHLIAATINPSVVTPIRYIVTFFDVSKEQELENMKIDFVSMAAHELRTPLTAMRGYSKILKDEIWEKINDEQKEFFRRILGSVSSLSNLVDNLLNASRIEKGTLQLDIRPQNIVELAESTLKDLEQVAKTKKQTITFIKPQKDLPLVMLDKFRISEVFTNLIANAINYTPTEGKISVSIEEMDNYVLAKVNDNGEGIPSDAIPKLFSKFFRVGGKLEQGSKGTGLGLFIAKSILSYHRGDIWVESKLGIGSTFFFKLPIATKADIDKFNAGKKTSASSKGFFINPDRNKNTN